ncbi:hypothetical protein LTR85_011325 [Meristemomyces frigidus]|nr:hypothetical protein LTR85_011325 [Meristemomyces frigidus]
MAAPLVGVGVFLFRPSHAPYRFCLGMRKGSHGAGTYALPGGHLEHGESFEQCAAREVKEETGLDVHDVRFFTATNSVFKDTGKHYVTIFMTAITNLEEDGSEPEAQLMEPDKCEGWKWQTFGELRKMERADSSLFQPLVDLMEQRPDVCRTLEKRVGI